MNFSPDRRAVSEVISAIVIFAITVALLSSAFFLATSSISATEKNIKEQNSSYERELGVLVSLIYQVKNSTGTYLYFINYGWQDTYFEKVYLNGVEVSWHSNCNIFSPGQICYIVLGGNAIGQIQVVLWGYEIEQTI